MNRVYEYFTSHVFRGYNYTADAEICPPGASCEVIFLAAVLKMPIFEEILTNTGTWQKGRDSHLALSAKIE